MKRLLPLLLAVLPLAAAEFSPGGTSFDMAVFAPKPVRETTGENLLKNEKGSWRSWANVHGKSEKQKELLALCTRKTGKTIQLITPETVLKTNPSGPMISNKISQTVGIPAQPQVSSWQLRFRMRGTHIPGTKLNTLAVFCAPENPDPEKPKRSIANGKKYQKNLLLAKQWNEVALPFQVPPHTSRLTVTIALYGMGEAFLEEIRLAPEVQKEKIEVRATPFGFMDDTYAVGENLPGIINFAFSSPNAPKRKKLTLDVTLPAGFEAVDSRDIAPICSRTKNADGTTTVKLDLMRLSSPVFTRSYYSTQAVSLMVRATGVKAGKAVYPLTYRLSDTKWQGKMHTLNLKVIPAVQGLRPKHFRTAAMISHEFSFAGPGVDEAVRFYDQSGFSAVHGAREKFADAVKKLGIPRYKGEYFLCNGFRLGSAPKPDYAQFKMADGKPYKRKICPVEVYTKGPYYKEHVRSIIAGLIAKNDVTDNLMSNWEPYYLDSKGCFCDRCRQEFIRWAAGNPVKEEIEAAWSKDTLRVHGERWMLFRSYQHGRLMTTLEEECREQGKRVGKDSHFVPEISGRSMTFTHNSYCKQYNVLDYINDLPWIEPWGPYNFYELGTPYTYYPTRHLTVYLAARQMKEFARAKARPGSTPKLIAFPHSFQGNNWITEPEAIAFEVLCFFMQQWEGAFLYYFPRGYDYRYWGAMARANTLISEYEDFLRSGTDVSRQVKLEGESPLPRNLYYPPAFAGEGTKARVPGLSQMKPIQFRAFRLKDELLVGVGNFWQKGEHFFTLQVRDLPKGNYQVTAEECDLGRFSEKELAAGILLQVGALRWQFIRISPHEKPLKKFSQTQMKALRDARLPEIRKAAEAERKLYLEQQASAAAENPGNDLSAFKAVSHNGVEVSAAVPALLVKSSCYQVQINLNQGGRLSCFHAGNGELAGDGNTGWFFLPGFWYPKKAASLIASSLKLESVTPGKTGIQVKMSRLLTPKDKYLLAGLHLTFVYDFAPDSITASVTLKNASIDAVEHAFRFHSMPEILGKKEKRTGKAVFGDGTTAERRWLAQLFRLGAPDALLEGTSRMDHVQNARSHEVMLSAPWLKSRLKFDLPGNVCQVIFWDSSKQPNSTFEPVYDRVILAPGASVEYTLKATVL